MSSLRSRIGYTQKLELTTSTRFINNEWVKGVDGKKFETIDPSTEKPIISVHEASEKDVDIAVYVSCVYLSIPILADCNS